MKLAEALIIRADLQKRIGQLKERAKDSARVQEGDTPAEEVTDLFAEMESILAQLEDLIYRINLTNIKTCCEGESLTHMMARKDIMTIRLQTLRDTAAYITGSETRYGRNEIRYVRTVDMGKLRKQIDQRARELRELDTKIQGLNWTTDIVERDKPSTGSGVLKE